MPEQTIFQQGEVLITTARFVVPGETYAMSGIVSVKTAIATREKDQKSSNPCSVLLGSVVMFMFAIGTFSFGKWLVGTILLFVAVVSASVVFYKEPATHTVVLRTSSSEIKALESQDEQFIRNIVEALNEAIVKRG